jgi:glycosyltransferase involved in cell wall biosynthesis
LRILTFLHSFEPGGVEKVALRLVRHWRDLGVDAPLFMGRMTGAMFDELGADLPCEVPRQPPFAVDAFETLWMIATLPVVIRRLKPDALFCAGNSYAVVAVAMKLILGRQCPPILAKISNDLDRRDMIWPARLLYRWWLRAQGHFIDHFVGMERPMEQEIAETIRPRSERISIIPDPALSTRQIETLREHRENQGVALSLAHRFVAIGRLAPQKNFALLLQAFAKGTGPSDTLTIFGDGPQRLALIALAERLGIARRVTFAGHVANPSDLLFCFDIFLLSSDYEGVPAVVLEALACGLPIIATNCSRSMSALLEHGKLGRLVPVGDVTALSVAIAEAGGLHQNAATSLEQARRFTLELSGRDYLNSFGAMITNSQCWETAETRLRHNPQQAVTAPDQQRRADYDRDHSHRPNTPDHSEQF